MRLVAGHNWAGSRTFYFAKSAFGNVLDDCVLSKFGGGKEIGHVGGRAAQQRWQSGVYICLSFVCNGNIFLISRVRVVPCYDIMYWYPYQSPISS